MAGADVRRLGREGMNLPGYGAVGGMSSIHSSTLVTVIRSSANDWKKPGDQQRP
jgi:hypothetical protein